MVTAVALRLVPAIAARAVAWAAVESPMRALELLRFLEARTGSVEGFELVPQDTLRAGAEAHPRNALAAVGRASLARARRSDDGRCRREHLGRTRSSCLARLFSRASSRDAAIASSEAQADAFWRLRDSISEAERSEGQTLAHDISVPVADMPRFIIDAAAEVERAFPGVIASGFGHLGDGNIHFHVRAGGHAEPDWYEREGAAITRMVDDLVTAAGGSISAEHGIGQLKLAEFARLAPPGRIHALQAIKHALDPLGIMNPGKLVP